MSDANAVVVRRFVEEYQSGNHDLAVAYELLAPDLVNHNPFGSLPPDRDGVIGFFDLLFVAFGDFHAVIHVQVSEGDLVTTRKTFHGVHQGDFMGVAATGRAVAWDVIDILRVANGQMHEHWNVADAMGLAKQLGAIPPDDHRCVKWVSDATRSSSWIDDFGHGSRSQSMRSGLRGIDRWEWTWPS